MTCAEIEAAFSDSVFSNSAATAITARAYAYDLTQESEFELGKMHEAGELSFFEYLVERAVQYPIVIGSGGRFREHYIVSLRYTCQQKPDGSGWPQCRDAINTIIDLVFSELPDTWSGTVDRFAPQANPPQITVTRISETPCYRAVFQFEAFKDI